MPRNTGVKFVSMPGEDDERRAVLRQAHDGVLEELRDGVRVGPGADDVVAARREGDEVGLERDRGLDLGVDDLPR